jgi:hypothetical protein
VLQLNYLRHHLRRKHSKPVHCNRCKAIFDGDSAEEELDNHQNADVPCNRSPDTVIDGIAPKQVRKYSRGKSGAKVYS